MADTIPDSSKKLFEFVRQRTNQAGNSREADALAYMLLEHVFGIDKNDIILDRSITLDQGKTKVLNQFIRRVQANEPIQYVIGEAYFYGRSFYVDASVLIPRKETEELIQLIIEENKGRKPRILDIGTGTGCIPITLAKESIAARCYALEISPKALKIARKNADRHDASIEFVLMDILNEDLPTDQLDVIVSNPPYVTHAEKDEMEPNVLDFEPHTALFVPNDDPLLFYERIISLAVSGLKTGGRLYFEVNEAFAHHVAHAMEREGFVQVQVVEDLHRKNRFVRGELAN